MLRQKKVKRSQIVARPVERRAIVVPVLEPRNRRAPAPEPALEERTLDGTVADRHGHPGHGDPERAGRGGDAPVERHHHPDVVAEPRERQRQRPATSASPPVLANGATSAAT